MRCFLNCLKSFIFLPATFSFAFAQSEGGYVPPKGEQPTYGKKYYPTEAAGNPDDNEGNVFLEVNPVHIIFGGIGLESEFRVAKNVTLGADFLLHTSKFSYGSVEYSDTYFGFAPKVRFYPFPFLGGAFFGLKVYLGGPKWTIKNDVLGLSAAAKEISDFSFLVSPCVHVGYRWNYFGKATLALYLGAGYDIPGITKSQLTPSDLAIMKVAQESTNFDKAVTLQQDSYKIRGDFGFSLGVFF